MHATAATLSNRKTSMQPILPTFPRSLHTNTVGRCAEDSVPGRVDASKPFSHPCMHVCTRMLFTTHWSVWSPVCLRKKAWRPSSPVCPPIWVVSHRGFSGRVPLFLVGTSVDLDLDRCVHVWAGCVDSIKCVTCQIDSSPVGNRLRMI